MKKIISLLLLLTVLFSFSAFAIPQVASADQTTHEVTFKLDKDTVYDMVEVNHNGYLQMPETPMVEGKIFIEWQTEQKEKFSFRTRIVEDMVLYASFENTEKYYNVTFKIDEETISVQRVKEGDSAIEPKNLKLPEGKTFTRWNQNFNAIHSDLVVEAVLAPVYYTVNVYAETEFLNVIRVKHGEALNLSEIVVPEKANYQAEGFVSEIDISSVKSNGDVFVNYVPVTYNVTFKVGTEDFDVTQARYGERAKMPINQPQAEENYYFSGWAVGSEDGTIYDFNTLIQGDLTLYAVFKPIEKPKYEVKFYDYNGDQYGATQTISEGGSAIEPGYPLREGYTFDSWNVDFTKVYSDLNVYPIYLLNSYTVTFKDYLGVIATEEVLYGQSVAIDQTLVREKDGYQFVRFDRSLKNITNDTVINAVYSIKTYNVRFYSANLTSLGGLQRIKHGQNAVVPNAEKEGYTFLGWKNLNTGEIESTENITKDCSFVAQYSRNVYTVTFMEEDSVLHTMQVEYGRGFSFYSYEKTGYLFDGWYYDKELTNKCYSTSVGADTIFYAKWIEKVEEINLYTVSFIVDGVIYNQQIIEHGGSIVMPEIPVKEGYVFDVWETDYGNYGAGTPIAYKVYCDWTITATFNEATFAVSFYFGNHSWAGYSETVKYGESVTFPDDRNTDKTGYIFKGWDREFSNVTSDLIVNAIYEPIKYTINFTDDKGEVLYTQKVNYGECIQWVDDPAKEGYTFNGWWPSLNYNSKVVEDVTFKAQFSTNQYKIYYYVDGVLWSHYTTTVSYGNVVSLRGAPSIDTNAKKFLGWSEAPETMPAHDIEIYGTTYTYQYFNVYYLIDGEVWRTKNIREGKEIPIMTVYDVPDKAWKDAHENIVFKYWGEQPYYMPAEDVYVDAVIEKYNYYKVYFYIDGELYKVTTCLEGKQIPLPDPDEIQAMYDETKVFDGWGDLAWTMPSHDVEAHAEFIYKNYYTLNYYIEGKIFRSFTLLEGTTIEDTEYELTHADVPKDYLPENKEFRGWSTIPQWMPKNNVTVNAYVHELKYYKLTYMVDFDEIAQFDVLEGQPLPEIADPETDGTRWFIGWTNEDISVMPNRNVQRSAQWNYLNQIVSQSKRIDGENSVRYEISIKVTGIVNLVAIKFKVEVKDVPADVILDENYASYNPETGVLLFASGEVITEETTLVTFSCGIPNPMLSYSFSGFEIYTIDDEGNIVSTVCYMNGNKHQPK